MGCRSYVAAKYDVEWQCWLRWEDFDKLINKWEDLYEIFCPGEFGYATDEYNNWYEFDKNCLQTLLNVLNTFREENGKLYPAEVSSTDGEAAESAIDVEVRERLKELLEISKNMDYVRVEFDS